MTVWKNGVLLLLVVLFLLVVLDVLVAAGMFACVLDVAACSDYRCGRGESGYLFDVRLCAVIEVHLPPLGSEGVYGDRLRRRRR